MNKFEQLIEYVINDEEQKARDLFHEIVVDKSREIFENLMSEEEVTEEVADELDEEVDELGGDQSDDLIDDIESEEEGIAMEADTDDEDHHDDMGGNEELEDRVVDLEDKLDELMAEFEAMMDGDDAGDELSVDDTVDLGDDDMGDEEEEVMDTEFETEGMMEGVDLKAAPKPVTSEEGSVNTKSTVAANSGAKGMDGKPVKATGSDEKGRPAPGTKDLGVTPTQDAGKGAFKSSAPKAVTAQANGVNTKSPY